MWSISQYIDFLYAMTAREINTRYRRAVFGFFWIFLNPLLEMFVIGTVFSFFINIPNYFLFLFTGLLPWAFFSMSLSKATPSLVFDRLMLQKANFPKEAILISIILSNFFHLIISLLVFMPLLIVFLKIDFVRILLLAPGLLWLMVITLGISFITSCLQVRYRDVSFFVQTLLMLWFYITPILYSLTLIPSKLHIFYALNPLTTVFELFHYAIFGQGVFDKWVVFANLAITVVVVSLGLIIYRRQHKFFVDWL